MFHIKLSAIEKTLSKFKGGGRVNVKWLELAAMFRCEAAPGERKKLLGSFYDNRGQGLTNLDYLG